MRITIEGSTERIETQIAVAGGMLDDLTPLWGAVSQIWARTRAQVFATRGASLGSAWPTYRQTGERQYAAIKSSIFGRRVGDGDILRWQPGRERLYPSLTDRSHPEYIERTQRDSLTLGTAVPYASDHNRGQGRAPERLGGHAIPRRPFMRFGRNMERQVAGALGNFAGNVAEVASGATTRRVGLTTADVQDIMRGVR